MLRASCLSLRWEHLPSWLFALPKASLARLVSSAFKDDRRKSAAVASLRKAKANINKSELPKMHRVIVLVDMDCFYVQVEERLAPEYKGKACAVAQYNNFQGGGLIAVNYEARAAGVKRGMRGDQALKLCKDLHLFRVPEVRGKADLTRYRNAGEEVLKVMSEFSGVVERASIDEAYLDLTDAFQDNAGTVVPDDLHDTHVVGCDADADESVDKRAKGVSDWLSSIEAGSPDYLLAHAAKLVEQIRAAIFEKTGFRCSAGIAHNKVLAKLACGLHKPNQQTVLPQNAVPGLFAVLPVHKLRKLGGKLGEDVKERLQVETVGELARFSEELLINTFGEKTGAWLYKLARGVDDEPVTFRKVAKSIGCGKNFNGKLALNSKEKVKYWVQQLSEELSERLCHDREQNRRTAQLLVVGLRHREPQLGTGISRSCPLTTYDAAKIAHDAFSVLAKINTSSGDAWTPPLVNLSLAASKFRDMIDDNAQDISKFLSTGTSASKEGKKTREREMGKAVVQPVLPAVEGTSELQADEGSEDTKQTPESAGTSTSDVGNPDASTHKEEGTNQRTLSFAEKLNRLLSDGYVSNGDDDKVPKTDNTGKVSPSAFFLGKPATRRNKPRDDSKAFLVDPRTVDASVLPFLPANIQDEIQRSMEQPSGVEKKLRGLRKYFSSSPVKQTVSGGMTNETHAATALESQATYSNGSGGFMPEPETGSAVPVVGQDEAEDSTTEVSACGSPRAHWSRSTSDGHCRAQQSDIDIGPQDGSQRWTSVPLHNAEECPPEETKPQCISTASDNAAVSKLDPELVHVCSRCGEEVPVWDVQEHDDFHLASDLSRGVQRSQVPVAKRKKLGASRKGRPSKRKAENTRTLEDFFK